MAAVSDNGGTEIYWFDGEAYDGVRKSSSPPDAGTELYWYEGVPASSLFPVSGGGSTPGAPEAFYTLMIGM